MITTGGLGALGSCATQQCLQSAEVTPSESDTSSVGATWPLAALAVGTVGLGAAVGATIGMRQFAAPMLAEGTKAAPLSSGTTAAELSALHAQGALLGAQALGIATLMVGGVGTILVGGIGLALGVNSMQEFSNVMAGLPKDAPGSAVQSSLDMPDPLAHVLDSAIDSTGGEFERHDQLAIRLRLSDRGGAEMATPFLSCCFLRCPPYMHEPEAVGCAGLHMVADCYNAGSRTCAHIILIHDTTPVADRSSALAAIGGEVGIEQLVASQPPGQPAANVMNKNCSGYSLLSYDQRGHGQSTTSSQRQRQLWSWLQPSVSGNVDLTNTNPLPATEAKERAEDVLAALKKLEVNEDKLLHIICVGGGSGTMRSAVDCPCVATC
eukprot:SAG31_NODE_5234_length_2659_cov_1.547266_2_plen_380_part_00